LVAISTDGRSPTLARRIKSKLEVHLSEGLGRLADFISSKRTELGGEASRHLWDALIDSTIPDLLDRGDAIAADRHFEHLKNNKAVRVGLVSLVGAGPGDPSLLTLKALRCMERADVVYYDNLVSREVLDRVRKDAQKVYVGKKRKFAGIRQVEINRLLKNDALEGKRVVRLKGGDPFMFGRGGEEIESLVSDGIDFEVVPGITAALGCAAYAGIPLTHRDFSQSVRFVTGHLKSDEIHLDWPELARPEQTLVVYMGLANLKLFTDNLLNNGMASDVGIAVISRGTFPDQKVIKSTVGKIGTELDHHELVSPTTAIIGDVVSFADRFIVE
ncbi:MAG: siroheme synthase CysG, partial [Gammaproteobacteria bacterium]|nr:siroheme synthase CysG [Gammaproteobacteria bacterium]